MHIGHLQRTLCGGWLRVVHPNFFYFQDCRQKSLIYGIIPEPTFPRNLRDQPSPRRGQAAGWASWAVDGLHPGRQRAAAVGGCDVFSNPRVDRVYAALIPTNPSNSKPAPSGSFHISRKQSTD